MSSRYHEVYRNSQEDPEGFWAEAAGAIEWFSPWDKVFDPDQGIYGRWYTGATTNMCHNAVDRHVSSGRADQLALVHDSAITGTKTSFTYHEMLSHVNAALARQT